VTTTSTSNKTILLALVLAATISFGAASHESGFETGFDTPELESHSEIVTLLVAPFLFVTLLLQITLNAVLRSTIGRGSNGHDPNYKKFSTVMALSITAMLVPSPFWQYIILAGDSIGVISVSILLLVFVFLFGVVLKGAKKMGNNKNRRYRRE
jgi:heme/copper-type cytochrome/quinol oxidase subunit 2